MAASSILVLRPAASAILVADLTRVLAKYSVIEQADLLI
jgi:hypothetical protein